MDQQQQFRWRTWTTRWVLFAGGIVVVLIVAVLIGYSYGITLWDWIKLLIVPAVLAVGGVLFSQWQQARDRADANRQQARDRAIADRRAQDDALEAYLDDMTNLMIDHHLRAPPQGEDPQDVRAVARARTLTLLRRLDGERKGHVVQFLYESDLITKVTQGTPAVDLGQSDPSGPPGQTTQRREYGADLSGANLAEAFLIGADLSRADLSEANLSEANLAQADLSGTDLSRVNLTRANLLEAKLSEAKLSGAKLNYAWLYAPMYAGPVDATGADLSGADLSGADLTEAQVAPEQLDQAAFLTGATMPDGSKHE